MVHVNWSSFKPWISELISTLEKIKYLENFETDCTFQQKCYSKDMQHKIVRMMTILLALELESSASNWYILKESEKTNFSNQKLLQSIKVHSLVPSTHTYTSVIICARSGAKWAMAASFCTTALVMERSITIFWANHWKCQNILQLFKSYMRIFIL